MAFLTPDKAYSLNGVTVKDFLLTEHNQNKISMPTKRTKTLAGITIHNTGIIRVSNTTMAEQYTRATYNGNMGSVRVHYYVDDKEAWHNLPDTWQGWHSADGNGGGNSSTIAIECIMGGNTGYEKSEDNCARLTAYLLYSNGLTTANVFTHTYWLNVRDGRGVNLSKDERCVLAHPYKVCPIYIIPHWSAFISKVDKYLVDLKGKGKTNTQSTQTVSKVLYTVQTGAFSVRENAETHLKEVKKYFPNAYIKISK